MIAHSLTDPFFGPAQKLHGATYIVDASFFTESLNKHQVVMDIGLAQKKLDEVLSAYNYQNLDALDELSDQLTTTEFMAKVIHEKLKASVKDHFSGKIRVTLGESHLAWASYEE